MHFIHREELAENGWKIGLRKKRQASTSLKKIKWVQARRISARRRAATGLKAGFRL